MLPMKNGRHLWKCCRTARTKGGFSCLYQSIDWTQLKPLDGRSCMVSKEVEQPITVTLKQPINIRVKENVKKVYIVGEKVDKTNMRCV